MKKQKSEKDLENACCMIARAKGLVAFKLEGSRHVGIPDREFMRRGGQSIYVEFKRPDGGGIVSKEQKVWADFIGNSHFFCSSIEEFRIS